MNSICLPRLPEGSNLHFGVGSGKISVRGAAAPPNKTEKHNHERDTRESDRHVCQPLVCFRRLLDKPTANSLASTRA